MELKIMRKLLLSLALVLACWQSQAAVLPAEKLLPKETVAVYTLGDVAKEWANFTNLPVGKLYGDPAIKAFKDKFVAKFTTEVADPAEKLLGIKFGDYQGLIKGQFTFAVIQNAPTGSNAFAPILYFDAQDQAGKVKSLLADAQKKWTDSGKKIKKETIRGTEFATFIITKGDVTNTLAKLIPSKKSDDDADDSDAENAQPTEITIGVADTLLLVSTTPAAIEKILTKQSGGLIPSLEEDPSFQADFAAHFRDTPGYMWVNIKALVAYGLAQKGSDDMPSPVDPKKILGGLGLLEAKTVGLTWRTTPEGCLTQFFVDVPETGRKGLFKLFAADRKDSNPPPFVPANAVEFARWRLDLPQFWANLESMIVEIYPPAKQGIDTMFEMAGKDKDEKFDLKAELLGSLGNDLITYKKSPKGMTLAEIAAQPTLFLIGSPKPEKLAAAIKTTIESFAPTANIKDKDFLGRKLYSITPAEGSENSGSNGVYFAASGGYLAISAQLPMIEEYLRSSDSKDKSLNDLPGLNEAAQKVGGMNTGLFGYNNQREQVRIAFEMVRQNTNTFADLFSSLPGHDGSSDGWKKFSEWVDFSLLPQYDTISKYFYFSVFSGLVDANGYTFTGFTPFPPEMKKDAAK